jgi:hypothetical protein
MRARFTMRAALDSPKLFAGILGGESWAAWRAILLAAMGEPLSPAEAEAFTRLTGRSQPPAEGRCGCGESARYEIEPL